MKLDMKHLLYAAAFVLASSFSLSPQCALAENAKATYTASDAQANASELSYVYHPGSLYEINCQIGYITDICLKPGETVTKIAGGDTLQWMVDQGIVNNQAHIYLKPKAEGIETNLIINTNTRSYRLLVKSVDYFDPVISWTYPADEKALREAASRANISQNRSLNTLMRALQNKRVNSQYVIKRKKNIDKSFEPLKIYDDGVRTYIKMPKDNRYDLPVLYNVGKDKKLTLINYRVKNDTYIADKCFTRARLIFAPGSSLDFMPAKVKKSVKNNAASMSKTQKTAKAASRKEEVNYELFR